VKLKKGDRVKVLSGKDRGVEGLISRVIPERNRVIVEGVNLVKKHQRATQKVKQAGIIERNMPVDVSNVAILSPQDGKPTRIGYRFDDQGNKFRICKRTGSDLRVPPQRPNVPA
jgi:large subunit ribosomal protein L24